MSNEGRRPRPGRRLRWAADGRAGHGWAGHGRAGAEVGDTWARWWCSGTRAWRHCGQVVCRPWARAA